MIFPARTFQFRNLARGVMLAALLTAGKLRGAEAVPPTFNREVAPILYQHCSGCHRPGQAAPFSLLSYTDAKKRAQDIAAVTSRRLMPPWLPEPGHGKFSEEALLSDAQIQTLQRWAVAGAPEGAEFPAAKPPEWKDGWQLGAPDLVLEMALPYALPPDGPDIYRNFVLPASLAQSRYVRGVEFRAANPKVVHHAFVKVDRTTQSRRLDEKDAEPGFPGMGGPAEIPDGHFLGWQPGRLASFVEDGLAWRMDPGNDLVLQMHLKPSGKPEQIRASVGLYFTDRVPTNTTFRLQLASLALDIPAGETNYVVEDSITLPVDTHLLAILPHAHFLARDMRSWAILPDGRKESLLWIKDWNFDLHSDYRYSPRVFLPKGSSLWMRYVYDNSSGNPRNPNQPPRPVVYGPKATDEMAQLFFQLLPASRADLPALQRAQQAELREVLRRMAELTLRKNPNDAPALTELAMLSVSGQKIAEAEQLLRRAVRSAPEYALGRYWLGLVLRMQNRLPEARAEFEAAVALAPEDNKALGNLGFVLLDLGDPASARRHFEAALRLSPDDALARAGLTESLKRIQAQGSK